jgi:2-methylisocitrate lyase-like PEP mutase family enzyme
LADGPGTRLKASLEGPEVALLPGGFSPFMARMIEELGFDGLFMAGSQTNIYVYGLPDIGLIGMREMIENARRITAVSDIPVFMDGDTGFGNVLNVYRTVREAAQAGVAMMSLEDQEAPKRSGTAAGRRCISEEEALGKVKAAVEERDALGSDMLICARTDLIGSEGGDYEMAVDRCIKFSEVAGADVVWINTPSTFVQMQDACARIPGPVIPLYGGAPPAPNLDEWKQIGAAAVLFPSMTTTVGTQAIWEMLNDFKERGVDALREASERGRSGRWGPVNIQNLLRPSPHKVAQLEADHLPQEAQRDYENTWGHPTQM